MIEAPRRGPPGDWPLPPGDTADPAPAAEALAIALMRERGPAAARHALRCAELCLIRGQSSGYAAWRDVLRAIELREAAAFPAPGEDAAVDPAFIGGPLDPLLRAHDAAAER